MGASVEAITIGNRPGAQASRRQVVAALAAAAAGAGGCASTLARKGKKKPKTVSVTRTFVNDGQIRIPATVEGLGAANPYPASITVEDFPGVVTNVVVTLKGVSHEESRDVEVMLAKDTTNAVLMGRAGFDEAMRDVRLTFDDAAAIRLPENTIIASGSYQPTNFIPQMDLQFYFRAPAPFPSGNTRLAAFRGLAANGTWRLYVTDGSLNTDGGISGGWELVITADVPKKRKKKKKR